MHFTVHGTQDGIAWANTFWLRNGSRIVPTAAGFQQATIDFHHIWLARFLEHVGDQVRVSGSQGLYYGPNGADLGSDYEKIDTGSQAGKSQPAQVSTGISWRVQAHYRGGHPRTYLPPPSDAALADVRTFKPSHTADVAAAANGFLSDCATLAAGGMSDVHLGTVSFVLHKQWRTPPVFRDYIPGAASVDARIDTQRSRLGRDV